MRKIWFVIVALLLAGAAFSAGCSSTSTTTVTVIPGVNYTTITASPTSQATPILLVADSFTLIPFTADNEIKYKADTENKAINQITTPYNKYGVYYSKLFFVNAGEKVQIVINSGVPANDLTNQGQLSTQLILLSASNSGSVSLLSSNVVRTQSGFTTTRLYSIDTSRDCVFMIFNNSLQNADCQVTISILK